jgi:two-component system phosphate regulon response regulator OmpR
MTHILLVDDDVKIRELVRKYLQQHGYIISEAADTREARDSLKELEFDLIVMDVMMPGETGIEFLISASHIQTPIILLTALGEVDDRLQGLEVGAADYIAKPFEPRELLLRIQNILRINSKTKQTNKTTELNFSFGPFQYDLSTGKLTSEDQVINLTSAEEKLLECLLKNHGYSVSRNELALYLGNDMNARSVDAVVSRLRSKIEKDVRNPEHIVTTRGQGYKLVG